MSKIEAVLGVDQRAGFRGGWAMHWLLEVSKVNRICLSSGVFAGSSSAVLFYSASDICYDTDRMQICSKESSDTPPVSGEGFQQYSSRISSGQWFSLLPHGALRASALHFDRVAYTEPVTSGEFLLSKIGRAILSFAFHFLLYKPANKVPYGSLPLAEVLFRVLCSNTKWTYDEAGVNPEVCLLDSKDDITLFQIFVITLEQYWRDAWLEQRLNAS
jgi:hypothetical protein